MGLEGFEEVENQRQNEGILFLPRGFQMSPGDVMVCLCAPRTLRLVFLPIWGLVFGRLEICSFCRIILRGNKKGGKKDFKFSEKLIVGLPRHTPQ